MRLSPLFSHGMVLQRNADNILWGTGIRHRRIYGTFAGISFELESDDQGNFSTILPRAEMGGPYELRVSDGEGDPVVIEDILVGDVFLLGGQSNMELPLKRTLDLFRGTLTEDPWIRLFEVPKECLFGTEREELEGGAWFSALGETLEAFSAVGYFMAKECRDYTGGPVGLIQTAVGGTPIKAWCREDSLFQRGWYREELQPCLTAETMEEIRQREEEESAHWHQQVQAGFETPEGEWRTIQVPGLWEKTWLEEFSGGLILEKEFFLKKEMAGKTADLVLGALIDADRVYVNDRFIGETGYQYPPRRYPIPEGGLAEGWNRVKIHMFVYRGKGGFIPDKPYCIQLDYGKGGSIDVSGTWQCRIARKMPSLSEQTFFQYKASGLFNGMIHPLRKWKLCAFLFYQGESDTGCPEGYAGKMEGMIHDWRKLWGDPFLPFLYVQLSVFGNSQKPCPGTNWAKLREEQRQVLSLVPDTAMIVSLDAGEYNDLHPQDKKTVGYRLALAVKSLVYGEKTEFSGPVFCSAHQTDDGLELVFEHAETGFKETGFKETGTKETGTQVEGFEIEREDGCWEPVKAEIRGGKVWIPTGDGNSPFRVRYAWRDFPEQAELYNREGLPASPFITDHIY